MFINWAEEELKPEHGIPFDIKGVELGHRDGKYTFEVLVGKYSIMAYSSYRNHRVSRDSYP